MIIIGGGKKSPQLYPRKIVFRENSKAQLLMKSYEPFIILKKTRQFISFKSMSVNLLKCQRIHDIIYTLGSLELSSEVLLHSLHDFDPWTVR